MSFDRNPTRQASPAALHALRQALFDEALAHGQTLRLRATTSSMVPTIWPGDRVYVRREAVEPGDIALVALTSGELLAHRCVRVRGPKLVLEGDARGHAPHTVNPRQVVGRVVALRPGAWGLYLRFKHKVARVLLRRHARDPK